MKSLDNYVDAIRNWDSAEEEFIKELTSILNISEKQVKSIKLVNREDNLNNINLILDITLSINGAVELKGEDLAEINATFIPPKNIEIPVGQIQL